MLWSWFGDSLETLTSHKSHNWSHKSHYYNIIVSKGWLTSKSWHFNPALEVRIIVPASGWQDSHLSPWLRASECNWLWGCCSINWHLASGRLCRRLVTSSYYQCLTTSSWIAAHLSGNLTRLGQQAGCWQGGITGRPICCKQICLFNLPLPQI